MSDRPTHNPALGRLFAALRQAKGLSLRQAAAIGRRRKVAGLGYAALSRLELGQVKHPSQDQVRGVAAIYEMDYDVLARDVAALVYALKYIPWSEHVRQTSGVVSPSTTESSDVSPNPSVFADERQRALDSGLRDILATTLELLGTAGINVDDLRATPRGVGGISATASRPSARHRAPRAKVAGAGR